MPEPPACRRFLAGDAAVIGDVRRTIARVVAFDGYFIPRHEREDVVQEALLSLWRTVVSPGFDASREDLTPIAREVALRRCVDWMRRRSRTPRTTSISGNPGAGAPVVDQAPGMERPDDAVAAMERTTLKERVIAALREPCRLLIQMHVDEGLDYAEIARRQGRSEAAVRRQWCDCLGEARRLRHQIERQAVPVRGFS